MSTSAAWSPRCADGATYSWHWCGAEPGGCLLKACAALHQVCNHRFHNECLQRWGDTSCPVCRYCVNATGNTSHCATCGTSQVRRGCS